MEMCLRDRFGFWGHKTLRGTSLMSCSVQCVYGYRGEVDVIGEMGF